MKKTGLFIFISSLMLACSSPEPVTPTLKPTDKPLPTTTIEEPISATLRDVPVVPSGVSEEARAIYQTGLAQGRNAQIFTKVGDCMTDSPAFLFPFSTGEYDLGEWRYLQAAIDHFTAADIREVEGVPVDSFSNPSLTVSCGFNSASPLDPIWANPNFCNSGESPLLCEYRVSNASIAVIMLGTHDMYYTADKFTFYLDSIVNDTINAGVLPILVTFPTRLDKVEESETYNQVVIDVANQYGLPVANLWLALLDKPGYGIAPDEVTDLSLPADDCTTCFTEANLEAGETVHNWVVLQAIYEVWSALSE